MSDWLDDQYDSPSGDEQSLLPIKADVIKRIEDEFKIHKASKVRLRWVLENRMSITNYVYSSDLLEIFYEMIETGNYEGRLIKFNDISDIIIWRKPWHERNRLFYGAINSSIAYTITLTLTFILGLIFGKSCNQ